MKKKFSTGTPRFCYQMILIAVSVSLFLCGCQQGNKKGSTPAVEDKQPIRKIRVLSDNWRFQLDIKDLGEKERWFDKDLSDWGSVTVPQAWDCYEDAMWEYEGVGWYTTIIKPDDIIETQLAEGRFTSQVKTLI